MTTDGAATVDRPARSRLAYGVMAVTLLGATVLGSVWTVGYGRRLIVDALPTQPVGAGLVVMGEFVGAICVIGVLSGMVADRLDAHRQRRPGATAIGGVGGLVGCGVVGLASLLAWAGVGVGAGVSVVPIGIAGVASGHPLATLLTVIPYGLVAVGFLLVGRAESKHASDPERPSPAEIRRRRIRTKPPADRVDIPNGLDTPGVPPSSERESMDPSPTNGEPRTTVSTARQSHARSPSLSDREFAWERETDVSMTDVGGMDDLKELVRRAVVKPLTTDPETVDALGLSPANVLLFGPPGTGKTHLAKAIATEVGLPFVRLSGSDVSSKWINESATKINALFTEAAAVADAAGGAIIFLDELDSVLPARGGDMHEENRKIVNEFLSHLQRTGEHNVVFVGATNQYDDLDAAAIRRGRIDRHIEVGVPDAAARVGILRAQLNDRQHAIPDEAIASLARKAEGVTAADLAGLVEDAAQHAAYVREDDTIRVVDFEAVTDQSY